MSAIKKKKGQVLSPDFILSIFIFTAILFLSYTIWNITYEKSVRFYKTEEMQRKAFYISNTLINTPGIPENWNTTDVRMIGLKNAGDDTLDTEKLISFKLLSYSESKSALGTGSYGYNINITDSVNNPLKIGGATKGTSAVFARDTGNNIIKDLMADYYDEWDYYWAGSITPPNNARQAYNNSVEDDLFDILMVNISSYDTIIIEDQSSLTINNDDRTKLQAFVDGGGTLIDIKDKNNAELINHFPNVPIGDASQLGDLTGIITEKDRLFPSSNPGNTITFNQQGYRFDTIDVDKTIVESIGTPGKCIICLWHYGDGKIYYIQDSNKDGSSSPLDDLDMDGIELSFGDDYTSDATSIVPITRLIMIGDINEVRLGIMHLNIYTNRTI